MIRIYVIYAHCKGEKKVILNEEMVFVYDPESSLKLILKGVMNWLFKKMYNVV